MTKASLQSVSIGGGVPLDQSLRGLLKLYGKRLRLTSAVFSLTSIHVGTFFAAVLVFRLSGLEIYPASQLTLAALAVLLAASMTTTAFRASERSGCGRVGQFSIWLRPIHVQLDRRTASRV